jgi:CAAX prenyl protease-like protein
MTMPAALPYVFPFAVFLFLLALRPHVPLGAAEYPAWTVIIALSLLVSRRVLSFRLQKPVGSVVVGIAVFGIWIAPELIWPGSHSHWLFQNALLGEWRSSFPEPFRNQTAILALRFLRAAALVPILEELFWRGWLMRWLIAPRFEQVPLGSYSRFSFWATAVLFAIEHGPLWDVGLLAGIAYNLWMLRCRRLGDCILAHAVTNACLSAYVVAAGRWEYW